jgi:hypothetical protein
MQSAKMRMLVLPLGDDVADEEVAGRATHLPGSGGPR